MQVRTEGEGGCGGASEQGCTHWKGVLAAFSVGDALLSFALHCFALHCLALLCLSLLCFPVLCLALLCFALLCLHLALSTSIASRTGIKQSKKRTREKEKEREREREEGRKEKQDSNVPPTKRLYVLTQLVPRATCIKHNASHRNGENMRCAVHQKCSNQATS